MKRVALAFALAPIAVFIALSLLSVLLLGEVRGGDMGFVLFLFGVPVSYASAALFGIPIYLSFRRRGWLKLWQVALGGAICAIPFVVVWFWGNLAGVAYPSGIFVLMAALVSGSLIALAFAWLARPSEV
jgi:hypothetical protein